MLNKIIKVCCVCVGLVSCRLHKLISLNMENIEGEIESAIREI